MGRNAAINQRKKQAKLRKRQKAKLALDALSIEELLCKAQDQIDCFQYETAQKLCQEALSRDPDNISALETSASLCLEVGNFDSAKHCLGRAITLQPEDGHEKYMSMAQLLSGKESLTCYQKGIEILTKLVDSRTNKRKEEVKEALNGLASESSRVGGNAADKTVEQCSVTNHSNSTSSESTNGAAEEMGACSSDNDPEADSKTSPASEIHPEAGSNKTSLARQLSAAYCSMAELFMTDLCDEEKAEQECQAAISQGIQADASNPEAYQHMASFLLVKQEPEEAKTFIKKSLDLWLPKYKEVDEDKAAAGSFDPVEVCPLSYSTRLSAARILIEVEDYKNATDVLDGLTGEDDEVVDTWYLLGWTYYLQGDEHRDAAKYYLHKAIKVHTESPSGDSQLVEHLNDLIQELGPYEEEEETEATEDGGGIEEELETDSEEEYDVEESMDTD